MDGCQWALKFKADKSDVSEHNLWKASCFLQSDSFHFHDRYQEALKGRRMNSLWHCKQQLKFQNSPALFANEYTYGHPCLAAILKWREGMDSYCDKVWWELGARSANFACISFSIWTNACTVSFKRSAKGHCTACRPETEWLWSNSQENDLLWLFLTTFPWHWWKKSRVQGKMWRRILKDLKKQPRC